MSIRQLTFHILISETTCPMLTKLGMNIHWMILYKMCFSVFCLPWFEIKHNKNLLCKKVKTNQSDSHKLDIQGHYANPGNKERQPIKQTKNAHKQHELPMKREWTQVPRKSRLFLPIAIHPPGCLRSNMVVGTSAKGKIALHQFQISSHLRNRYPVSFNKRMVSPVELFEWRQQPLSNITLTH